MPFNLITKVGTKEGNFPSGSIKVADEAAIFLMSFPLIKQQALVFERRKERILTHPHEEWRKQ